MKEKTLYFFRKEQYMLFNSLFVSTNRMNPSDGLKLVDLIPFLPLFTANGSANSRIRKQSTNGEHFND